MNFKSKKEIMGANMADWERETALKIFEEDQNISDNCKMILEHYKRLNE